MLPMLRNDKPLLKCEATRVALPDYVDPAQPPVKKRKPFASLQRLGHAHTLDIACESPLAAGLLERLGRNEPARYAKVIMRLLDIIGGAFFTTHVKRGNVLMIAEGRPGVDNCFCLSEGTLHLELDRATYERTGLTGRPVTDGGVKHGRNRFAVELDLRAPAMLPGKRGFDRVRWAFEHTLNQSLTWLFCMVGLQEGLEGPIPVETFSPHWCALRPQAAEMEGVLVPLAAGRDGDGTRDHLMEAEFNAELFEWASLVLLGSPQVRQNDRTDPYLSRYRVPTDEAAGADAAAATVMRLRWRGLLSVETMMGFLLAGLQQARMGWVALQVHGFAGETITVLVLPGAAECLEWVVKPPV